MSTNMLWIAKRDGKGWNSNRTRDVVDLAFTVNKCDGGAEVLVRIAYDSDPKSRARRCIGRMYFNDHKEAKVIVSRLVNKYNSLADQSAAHDGLLEEMLDLSLRELICIHPRPFAIINGTWVEKPKAVSTPDPEEETTSSVIAMGDLIDIPSVIPEDASTMVASVEGLLKAMDDSLASWRGEPNKVEETVVEEPTKVEEPKYIVINGKKVQIGWPS